MHESRQMGSALLTAGRASLRRGVASCPAWGEAAPGAGRVVTAREPSLTWDLIHIRHIHGMCSSWSSEGRPAYGQRD